MESSAFLECPYGKPIQINNEAKPPRIKFSSAAFLSGPPRSRQTSWGGFCRVPQEVVRLLGVVFVGVPKKLSSFLGWFFVGVPKKPSSFLGRFLLPKPGGRSALGTLVCGRGEVGRDSVWRQGRRDGGEGAARRRGERRGNRGGVEGEGGKLC